MAGRKEKCDLVIRPSEIKQACASLTFRRARFAHNKRAADRHPIIFNAAFNQNVS